MYLCAVCGSRLLLEFRKCEEWYVPHLRCRICKGIIYMKKRVVENISFEASSKLVLQAKQ